VTVVLAELVMMPSRCQQGLSHLTVFTLPSVGLDGLCTQTEQSPHL
jgi:hypothetical protein